MSLKGLTKNLINWYSIFSGAKYFAENGSQNYWIFQLIFKQLQTFAGADTVFVWKCKEMSEEITKTSVTLGNSFAS